jgi:uncharacterized peroxidase-related enzyme
MKTITVPTRDQVTPASQVIFDLYNKRMGKVPNLYATLGYSEHALKAFFDLDETLNKGVFTAKEREAISLVVSEINGCAYCLAGHTVAAIRRGFTNEETLDIRRGKAADPKLNAIIQLAASIAENKGHAEEDKINAFYEAGFDETALMELAGLVSLRVFTNYAFALTQIPVDFPIADPIK